MQGEKKSQVYGRICCCSINISFLSMFCFPNQVTKLLSETHSKIVMKKKLSTSLALGQDYN